MTSQTFLDLDSRITLETVSITSSKKYDLQIASYLLEAGAKTIASTDSAKNIYILKKPQLAHFLQAAVSVRSRPVELLYTHVSKQTWALDSIMKS